jgi:hypothetical protein
MSKFARSIIFGRILVNKCLAAITEIKRLIETLHFNQPFYFFRVSKFY